MPGLASSLHGRLTGTASRARPSKAAIAFESPKPLVCAIRLLPEMYEGQVCALLESKSCEHGMVEDESAPSLSSIRPLGQLGICTISSGVISESLYTEKSTDRKYLEISPAGTCACGAAIFISDIGLLWLATQSAPTRMPAFNLRYGHRRTP